MRGWLVPLMVAIVSLAGCLDDEAPVDDVEVEAPKALVTVWRNETHTGQATSASAGVVTVNPGVLLDETAHFMFHVPAGATGLAMEFTGSAHLPTTEADVLVARPGCEPNQACEQRHKTDGLRWGLDEEAPEPGQWTVRVFLGSAGADQIQWSIEVSTAVLCEEGAC